MQERYIRAVVIKIWLLLVQLSEILLYAANYCIIQHRDENADLLHPPISCRNKQFHTQTNSLN